MPIEVFHRTEKKYVIDNDTFLKMREFLKMYMIPDKYNVNDNIYSISNIYYDTHDDYLIRTSIDKDKPTYKEKLRLRSYGCANLDSIVYLELKKKLETVTYKRRTRLKLCEAYDFINLKKRPEDSKYINKQVLSEIEYLINIYNPIPKMKISYDRYAFFSDQNRDLRISFDKNIFFDTKNLKLESDYKGTRLLKENYWILEVKAEKAVPMWLASYLSENKIYSTGFSKYGAGHKKQLDESWEDEKCLLLQQQEPLLAKSLL